MKLAGDVGGLDGVASECLTWRTGARASCGIRDAVFRIGVMFDSLRRHRISSRKLDTMFSPMLEAWQQRYDDALRDGGVMSITILIRRRIACLRSGVGATIPTAERN